MIKRIDHIGVAVKDIEPVVQYFQQTFGVRAEHYIRLGGFYGAFLPTKDTPIELIQDMTPSGVITRFIEKKGEGLHHIAFEVQDIMAALDALRSRGVTIIDKAPREGARGSLVAFLHPKDSYGILIELVEHR